MVPVWPYSDSMTDAQLRTLTLTTTKRGGGEYRMKTLALAIDHVPQTARWGTGSWQVPADRPVTITVCMFDKQRRLGFAEYVLQPGARADLEYKAPAFYDAPGAIGPRGSVVAGGSRTWLWASVIGVGFVLAVPVILLFGLLLL